MPELMLQSAVDAVIPPEGAFRTWVAAALAGRHGDWELGIRVVGADEMQRLNRDYRGKDRPTNVLAFPVDLPEGVDLPLLGDLVLCAPVIAREAVDQGKAEHQHWAHLTVHGVLHLLGFDHLDSVEAEAMEAEERRVLAGMDIADPYRGDLATGEPIG
jgi:probable rRNA maturation factor